MKTQTIIGLSTVALLGIGLGFSSTSYADKATNATVRYTGGGLVMDPGGLLPSNLNFGSHPIQSAADETWTATSDGVQASPATTGTVVVDDNRGATLLPGWSVKVTQLTQFSADLNILTGAALSITAGAITNNLNSAPTGTSMANKTTTLNLLLANTVMTANAGEGAGETTLPITKFQLAVPKTALKAEANYQTTLNWTITASPL